jgi:hypothetical protein
MGPVLVVPLPPAADDLADFRQGSRSEGEYEIVVEAGW